MAVRAVVGAFPLFLGVCLGVTWGAPGNTRTVTAPPGFNSTLDCTAPLKPGVDYISVSWYKLDESPSPQRSGLLRMELPDGPTNLYVGVVRDVELLDGSWSLSLPNVTCADSGVYMCCLAAPVGERNLQGRVSLTVEGCPTRSTFVPGSPVDFPLKAPAEAAPLMGETMTDTILLIIATAILIIALAIFVLSYCCLKKTLKMKISSPSKKDIYLNAPLKPLEKKDLMLICTLGPKTPAMKHICV